MRKTLLLALALAASAACGPEDLPPAPRPIVLSTRAPESCLQFAIEDAPARLDRVYHALVFETPTQLALHPTASFVYVTEQTGRVRRFADDDAVTSSEIVLDLSAELDLNTWETGLLGFVLHPDYAHRREGFAKYTTRDASGASVLRVARFTGDAEGRHFDPNSIQVLIDLPNPDGYHHGGAPAFGPDGKLYLPFGDGGFMTSELSQDDVNLRGTIVRLDVDAAPYTVPADNPFVADPNVASEIFATGFRNPFGFSFAPDDGTLWVGDVGESAYEELDQVHPGDNHGWPVFEALACRDPERCTAQAYAQPAHFYGHEEGLTIVGGPVYRGSELPAYRDAVLFADFYTGRVQAFFPSTGRVLTLLEGGSNPIALTSDRNGEILLVDRNGMVHRLRANAGTSRAPARLSETGCMSADAPSSFAEGLIPTRSTCRSGPTAPTKIEPSPFRAEASWACVRTVEATSSQSAAWSSRPSASVTSRWRRVSWFTRTWVGGATATPGVKMAATPICSIRESGAKSMGIRGSSRAAGSASPATPNPRDSCVASSTVSSRATYCFPERSEPRRRSNRGRSAAFCRILGLRPTRSPQSRLVSSSVRGRARIST